MYHQPPAALSKPEGCRGLCTRLALKVPSIDGLLHSSEFAPTTCFIILAAPADCGPLQCRLSCVPHNLRSVYSRYIGTVPSVPNFSIQARRGWCARSRVLYLVPPPGYPGCWPGLAWACWLAGCWLLAAVSPRCLSPFPFPTVVGHFRENVSAQRVWRVWLVWRV